MDLAVTPRPLMFLNGVYVIMLEGTTALTKDSAAWVRSEGRDWEVQTRVAGLDFMVEVRIVRPESPDGTEFFVAVHPEGSAPGRGPARWSGRYRIRKAGGGLVLEPLETDSLPDLRRRGRTRGEDPHPRRPTFR